MSERHLAVLAGAGDLANEAIARLQQNGGRITLVPLPPRAPAGDGGSRPPGLPDPVALITGLVSAGVTHATMVGRVDLPAAARGRIATGAGGAGIGDIGLGDMGLMAVVAQLFAKAGIRLVGIHEVVPELLAKNGLIAGASPRDDLGHLQVQALRAARAVGALELGQGVVIGRGRAVAAEDAGGTDDLLRRVAELRRVGLAGGPGETLVLAKALKPGQPTFVDLPTIGPETIRLAAEAGIAAIIVEADRSLIVSRPVVEEMAQRLGVAVFGCRADD
jgi:DUF1009 family protein